MRRVLFIQHGEKDRPGLFGEVMDSRGVGLQVLRPDLGEKVPANLAGFCGLALGGGAQGVYETDQYPYLADEWALVRDSAQTENKPVLGLCLGAQLMATAFGAQVRPAAQKEIGFFEVELDPIAQFDPLWRDVPQRFVTTHWHGDVFEIPPGAMRMGSSRLTPNQLFRYGHAFYGLQFHLEMTPEILSAMIDESAEELREGGVDPVAMKTDALECLPRLEETARTVFARWSEFLGS